MKLLVIADDFTGALDTGVQFKAKNTLIRIRKSDPLQVFEDLNPNVQVLIVDAETRHMTPQEAYQTVHTLVLEAMKTDVFCIYKKTDSALRGNIGSELAAALEASGEKRLHFVPAFPGMDRRTEGGIHYIGDLPVAESVFGEDAFEPVQHSAVADIIAAQSSLPTRVIDRGERCESGEGIWIYDASTEGDLQEIARWLQTSGQLKLLAGCAGFAAMLPELLELEIRDDTLPEMAPSLLTISGSINPITVRQIEAAERAGMPRVRLRPDQKLTSRWMEGEEGKRCFEQWLRVLQERGSLIIECGRAIEEDELEYYEQLCQVHRDDMRAKIADTMGTILCRMLAVGADSTVLVTGGDTLWAFMQQIQLFELADICEILPGIVLTRICYRDRSVELISKSGGFGAEDLLIRLLETITAHVDPKQAKSLGAS